MNQAPEARPQLSPGWSAAEPWEKRKNEDEPRKGRHRGFVQSSHQYRKL